MTHPSIPRPPGCPADALSFPAMTLAAERCGAMSEWRLILGTGGFQGGPGAAVTVAAMVPTIRRTGRAALAQSAAPAINAAAGALNMAVDEALLESVQRGGRPVLRFYTWEPACLSFGRNQPARGLYDPARASAAGIDIVRRPTGGLAVLHDHELTYCVVAPLESLGGPRAAYAAINTALVEGLRACGLPVEQAMAGARRGPLHSADEPCFRTAAAGEVVALGRKLVGSAQRCQGGALLQHGSILLSGSQARVVDLHAPRVSGAPAGDGSVTLEELIGRDPPIPTLVGALCGSFERMFGTRLAPGRLAQRESARAEQLAARYRGAEWTWRR